MSLSLNSPRKIALGDNLPSIFPLSNPLQNANFITFVTEIKVKINSPRIFCRFQFRIDINWNR